MAVVYIITNTEGTDKFAIQPETLNGPGGVQQNSDLRLPGNGLLIWGEAYNENVYRLTENFAVPEKELNDFNPATGNNDYDPATDPLLPKDENDLGEANGINVPLAGQLWWNTTQSRLFVFDGSGWGNPNVVSSGGTAEVPGSCSSPGNLFFDTDIEQLLVCDGTSFVSVADRYLLLGGGTMTGDLILNGNPTVANQAANKNYVDSNFVELDGSNTPTTGFIRLNADPTLADHAATKNYVDTSIAGLSLDAVTGDIRMTIDQSVPTGWLKCNGETIGDVGSGADNESASYEDLFNLAKLGFGNTGTENFGSGDTVLLPNFNGRSPLGDGQGDTAEGGGPGTLRTFGTDGGAEEHTLTNDEMPNHRHSFERDGVSAFGNPGGTWANTGINGNQATKFTSFEGNDQPHNNMHPFLVINFLVKV